MEHPGRRALKPGCPFPPQLGIARGSAGCGTSHNQPVQRMLQLAEARNRTGRRYGLSLPGLLADHDRVDIWCKKRRPSSAGGRRVDTGETGGRPGGLGDHLKSAAMGRKRGMPMVICCRGG